MLKKLVFIQALLILSLSSAAGQAVDKTIRGAVSQGNTQRVLCNNCDDDMGDDDGSYDDYYYEEEEVRGKGKGKGKGGKGGKGGKKDGKKGGKGKGKGGKGGSSGDSGYPENGNCNLVVMNETFSIPRALSYVAPDTTSPENMGDPVLAGTVFLWRNQQVFEADGVIPITGTTVSGTCTRTNQDGDFGMGSCQLVFVDDDEYTITLDGLLTGPSGSSLGITGGSGSMAGAVGQMDFFPVFEGQSGSDGDIFINVTRYEIEAELGLIKCPSH